MSARIEARDVWSSYPAVGEVLRGVSLDLVAGERAVLLGPNGAGKSTLLRLLMGIGAPTRGQISIDGQPCRALSPRDRAKWVALLPQSLQSVPPVSVESFVWGGRYAHRKRFRSASAEDAGAVESAMRDAEILELRDRLLAELSGGQRQRVLLARAFAQQSAFLLVDEPTSSLDPAHQVRVMQLLAEYAERGGSVLFVTHEFHHARQFASRVLVLCDGRIAADGSPEDVLRPEVLEPVYGRCLHFAEQAEGAPLVVPQWVPPTPG